LLDPYDNALKTNLANETKKFNDALSTINKTQEALENKLGYVLGSEQNTPETKTFRALLDKSKNLQKLIFAKKNVLREADRDYGNRLSRREKDTLAVIDKNKTKTTMAIALLPAAAQTQFNKLLNQKLDKNSINSEELSTLQDDLTKYGEKILERANASSGQEKTNLTALYDTIRARRNLAIQEVAKRTTLIDQDEMAAIKQKTNTTTSALTSNVTKLKTSLTPAELEKFDIKKLQDDAIDERAKLLAQAVKTPEDLKKIKDLDDEIAAYKLKTADITAKQEEADITKKIKEKDALQLYIEDKKAQKASLVVRKNNIADAKQKLTDRLAELNGQIPLNNDEITRVEAQINSLDAVDLANNAKILAIDTTITNAETQLSTITKKVYNTAGAKEKIIDENYKNFNDINSKITAAEAKFNSATTTEDKKAAKAELEALTKNKVDIANEVIKQKQADLDALNAQLADIDAKAITVADKAAAKILADTFPAKMRTAQQEKDLADLDKKKVIKAEIEDLQKVLLNSTPAGGTAITDTEIKNIAELAKNFGDDEEKVKDVSTLIKTITTEDQFNKVNNILNASLDKEQITNLSKVFSKITVNNDIEKVNALFAKDIKPEDITSIDHLIKNGVSEVDITKFSELGTKLGGQANIEDVSKVLTSGINIDDITNITKITKDGSQLNFNGLNQIDTILKTDDPLNAVNKITLAQINATIAKNGVGLNDTDNAIMTIYNDHKDDIDNTLSAFITSPVIPTPAEISAAKTALDIALAPANVNRATIDEIYSADVILKDNITPAAAIPPLAGAPLITSADFTEAHRILSTAKTAAPAGGSGIVEYNNILAAGNAIVAANMDSNGNPGGPGSIDFANIRGAINVINAAATAPAALGGPAAVSINEIETAYKNKITNQNTNAINFDEFREGSKLITDAIAGNGAAVPAVPPVDFVKIKNSVTTISDGISGKPGKTKQDFATILSSANNFDTKIIGGTTLNDVIKANNTMIKANQKATGLFSSFGSKTYTPQQLVDFLNNGFDKISKADVEKAKKDITKIELDVAQANKLNALKAKKLNLEAAVTQNKQLLSDTQTNLLSRQALPTFTISGGYRKFNNNLLKNQEHKYKEKQQQKENKIQSYHKYNKNSYQKRTKVFHHKQTKKQKTQHQYKKNNKTSTRKNLKNTNKKYSRKHS